ncbi:MAG: hypothetical protein JWN34_4874 [Bryobacterales bacterium]|jgi:hypothetical protein|nr:hypothetical protein [Bryobacterales bacterium]
MNRLLKYSGWGLVCANLIGYLWFRHSAIAHAQQTAAAQRPSGIGRSFTIDLPTPAMMDRVVLWRADFETGDASQMFYPAAWADGLEGGGVFTSGHAGAETSLEYAHSGTFSMKMTITAPPVSAVRLFRWLEPQLYPELYYSVWYYLPQQYVVQDQDTAGYWNLFQWKSKLRPDRIDPFFVLNIQNGSDGKMYLYLFDWQTRQSYVQQRMEAPAGQWFNVTARYRCAGDRTGQVTFWQDGLQLLDVQNVATRYADGDCQWSVDNYSTGLLPTPSVFYVDDAEIFLLQERQP